MREYVESGTQAGEFYGRLLPLLEFLVPAYVAEGKSHLTIAIGCTGGRHRSVTVADRIRRDLERARRRRRAGQAPRRRARRLSAPHPANLRPAMPTRSISIRGLRKSYGELEAVRGIDLEVERGEVFAFLGPNGAGKTTTVEILEGYRERSGGEVERARRGPAARRRAPGASGSGSSCRAASSTPT